LIKLAFRFTKKGFPFLSGLGNCAKDRFAISYKISGSKEITFEKDKNLKIICHKKWKYL